MQDKKYWPCTAIAMLALLAHFSGGSWFALVILGIICYSVMQIMPDNMEALCNDKWNCLIQLIGIILLLGQLLPMSAQYWPGRFSEIVIPATLTVLGAYSCRKKPEHTAGILLWAMALLLIPVGIAGIRDIQPEWIIPDNYRLSIWIIPAMLLPMLRKTIGKGEKDLSWYLWVLVTGVIIWVITSGVLSNDVAENLKTPFRNLSMSLTLGAYSRFESIVSVALTFGWYGLSSLLFECACKCLEGLNIKKWAGILGCIFIVLTIEMIDVKIPPEITVIYTVIAWIFFPIFKLKKTSKKSEKSA